MPYLNRGYGIISSNAGIIISGTSTMDPGQDPYAVKTFFRKLNIGVWAQRSGNQYTLRISHSRFEDNLKGLYISGYTGTSYAEVTLSKFKVLHPSFSPTYYPYGMYLNTCSEYTVEENEFYFEGVDPMGLGFIINESGPSDNIIYNNLFHDLQFGVIAQGCNRYSDLRGLCFHCNDFYDNLTDIGVSSEYPTAPNQGVSLIQGNKTVPAGNTFTSITNFYDFYNPFDQIVYTRHEFGLENLTPEPRYGVVMQIALGLYYNKQQDCPSHLSGGAIIDEMIGEMNESKASSSQSLFRETTL